MINVICASISVIIGILIFTKVYFGIYLIMPLEEKRKMIPDWMLHEASLSVGAVLFFIAGFIFITVLKHTLKTPFLAGIQGEFFGIIFEIAVLTLIIGLFTSLRNKKERIKKYKDEIDDLRFWKADEAKFRIRALIKRLNDEQERNIDLTHVDVSESANARYEYRFRKLNMIAKLFESDFSNLVFEESDFSGTTDGFGSKFIKAYLHKAKFVGARLQGTNFEQAILRGADFSNAILSRSVSFINADIIDCRFTNTTIGSADFDYAKVREGFLKENNSLMIAGHPIGKLYDETAFPVAGKRGQFEYKLIPRIGAQVLIHPYKMFNAAFDTQEEGWDIIKNSAPVMNLEQSNETREKFAKVIALYEELKTELLKPEYNEIRSVSSETDPDDYAKPFSIDDRRKAIRLYNRWIYSNQPINL